MKLAAILLIVCGAILAAPTERQIQQAKDLFYRGTYGDKTAAAEADKLFSQLFKEAPQSDLVKAYYGSERLLQASHTWALWKKYSLSKQGIQLLDAAVSSAPGNLEVRFVRAVTTYNLPSIFGRKKQSETDFAYLSTRVEKGANEGTLEPNIAAAALLFYGRICSVQEHRAEAAAAWKSAANIAPLSKAGKDAAIELERPKG